MLVQCKLGNHPVCSAQQLAADSSLDVYIHFRWSEEHLHEGAEPDRRRYWISAQGNLDRAVGRHYAPLASHRAGDTFVRDRYDPDLPVHRFRYRWVHAGGRDEYALQLVIHG